MVAKYEAVVNFLFFSLNKGFLLKNVHIAVGQLLTLDNIFWELGVPSVSHSLLGFRLSACQALGDEVGLPFAVVGVDVPIIEEELTEKEKLGKRS